MNKLVLHHTYIDGSTFDVSMHGNHGVPHAVIPEGTPVPGAFRFNAANSGIMVRSSRSLQNLTSVRVRMKFLHEPHDVRHRYNLMEGFISFVLFVGPELSLVGGIVDAKGNWNGIESAKGVVHVGSWHEVEFSHDGVSRALLRLDGQLVAQANDIKGPVRSVLTPYGIGIGRWPDAARYVFTGLIGESQVWRFDPLELLKKLLARCCEGDPSLLNELLLKLRGSGVDAGALSPYLNAQQEESIALAYAVRAQGVGAAEELDAVALAAMMAMLGRDRDGFARTRDRMTALVERLLGRAASAQMTKKIDGLGHLLDLSEDDVRRLAASMCLSYMLPPKEPTDSEEAEPNGDGSRAVDAWDEVGPPDTVDAQPTDGEPEPESKSKAIPGQERDGSEGVEPSEGDTAEVEFQDSEGESSAEPDQHEKGAL